MVLEVKIRRGECEACSRRSWLDFLQALIRRVNEIIGDLSYRLSVVIC